MRCTAILLFAGVFTGCGTLTTARPLEPGEHVVGATFGGPILDAGFVTTPLPNLIIQGRSGITRLADRPLEVDYGINLTAAAFGQVGIHGGTSWLALDQNGGVPALSVTERLFFYDNHLNMDRPPELRASYLMNQLEVIASWDTPRLLPYVGMGVYLDFVEPVPMLTPSLGTAIHLGPAWDLQLEGRYYAVNRTNDYGSLNWVTPGPGALGMTISASRRFGGQP